MGKKRWGRNQEVQDTDPVNTEITDETVVAVEEIEPETPAEPVKSFEEAAAVVEAQGIEPVAAVEVTKAAGATRGVLPDAFGNNVKGERICKNCGIKESETLAKNPRYSFCKGLCVNCYGKIERKTTKPGELTIPQLEEKIAYYKDLLQKKTSGAQGLPEGNAIGDPNEVTSSDTIETHGASVASTSNATDELATISQ